METTEQMKRPYIYCNGGFLHSSEISGINVWNGWKTVPRFISERKIKTYFSLKELKVYSFFALGSYIKACHLVRSCSRQRTIPFSYFQQHLIVGINRLPMNYPERQRFPFRSSRKRREFLFRSRIPINHLLIQAKFILSFTIKLKT